MQCTHDKNDLIQSLETVILKIGDHEILVEYRDLHWFGKYKFYVVQGRGQSKYVIANALGANRTVSLHHLIMSPPQGLETDHINHNGLDNRRANLRIVTHQENQANLPKKRGGTSSFYGVSWSKERKAWCAYVAHNAKRKNLGRFNSELEAAHAYDNYLILNNLKKPRNFGGITI